MTVSELKAALDGLPDHHRVVIHVWLESDGESSEISEFVDAIDIVAGKDPHSAESAAIIRM